MKRIVSAAIVLMMLLCLLTGCVSFFKSDEEQITETVEEFFDTFNTGDYEGMLELMSERQQSIMESSMGLMGSLIGFDISDMMPLLFGFSMGTLSEMDGEMLAFEIEKIEIDGEDAKAYGYITVNMAGEVQTSYAAVKVVKEGFPPEWKIDYVNPDVEEMDLPMGI